MVVPHTWSESSDARKISAPIWSSGCPHTPRGVSFFSIAIISGSAKYGPFIGVSVGPGASAFTRMFCELSSYAMAFVRPSNPAFEAQYGDRSLTRRIPEIDATLMIFPFPTRNIAGMAAWEHRNGPVLEVVRAMERECPDAWFLTFTNPEAKIGEVLHRLTSIKTAGICHGQTAAKRQVSKFVGIPIEDITFVAAGINHFTWFQSIVRTSTGEDLYPQLAENERQAHWLADWDEMALSRILFRTFGLYPSPGTNHHGEYLGWAEEFLAASRFQYFYDPAEGHPWDEGKFPPRVYNMHTVPQDVPMFPDEELLLFEPDVKGLEPDAPLEASNSLVVPLMEGLTGDEPVISDPISIANQGAIPGLADDAIVEVNVTADRDGIHRHTPEALPEGILAILRTQLSINKILVEAYVEQSRNKLLQAILLDPTTPGYRAAVNTIDQLFELQQDVLPPLRWE